MVKKVYHKKTVSNQRLASPTPNIWRMPPYIVARFGGELTQIMLEAAQEYIYEKCLSEARKVFNEEITNQNLS